MADKRKGRKYARREFLRRTGDLSRSIGILAVMGTGGPSTFARGGERQSNQTPVLQAGKPANGKARLAATEPLVSPSRIQFPRIFTGRNLKMIAFPLGGIGTGTISLGGRGQLRDWEIFNRPDKGNLSTDGPNYCFPALWVQVGEGKPVARVLEGQIEPPYERVADGLGSSNVPGLPRFSNATFTGAYPFARLAFEDKKIPVTVSLEAFNPLVPLDVEASGLPAAVLRYTVRNPRRAPAKVGVAFSLENPVGKEGRQSTFLEEAGLSGIYMDNPFLTSADPLKGSVALCVLGAPAYGPKRPDQPEGTEPFGGRRPAGSVSYLRGWKRAQWWDGALTFWDDFTADGRLTSDGPALMPVSSLAVTQTIPAGGEAAVTFLIAWHFPNRTPKRCGWAAVEGEENTAVGNHYTTRFASAWEVARFLARELPSLEARARTFVETFQATTLHPAVLDAASSTLSTLRTNTCFRTSDGEFHGFEGCNDQAGCCHGSCTHVWNYEQATAFVFPSLARSLRESEFLRNTAENGQMGFRSYLPDGKKIWDKSAADGQMGCLMKLYRDWQLTGDSEWLRRLWPQAKRALEFAWIENGWDGDRDGVAEGVQHNTYDVEFFGPNPLCGVWYLGALRAGEEMARAVGDESSAQEYRRLFANGSKWFDGNLFNGEFYIQKVAGRPAEQIPSWLRVGMGAGNTLAPDYQMGEACLVDQLLGQYMAHVAGLGYLLEKGHVKKTLQSIFRYNYQANLSEHETVQRTYALNDEGGVLVATYPSGKRPEIPFPYFGEVWTGLEYQLAAHLAFEGLLDEALTVVETARRRFDGERRNPWNEAECGHHYARPMAAWAVFLALSGFHYSAAERELSLTLGPAPNAARQPAGRPRSAQADRQEFRSFWSAPCGWGSFSHTLFTHADRRARDQRVRVEVVEGAMPLGRLALLAAAKPPFRRVSAKLGSEAVGAELREEALRTNIIFDRELKIAPGQPLQVGLIV
jgi:uncharacterized protein (DUF608 family)